MVLKEAALMFVSFVLSFLLFIFLFGALFERKKKNVKFCPDCNKARKGKYCEVCGKRLTKTEDRYPRCWHCGAIFDSNEVPTFCFKCGFSQGRS